MSKPIHVDTLIVDGKKYKDVTLYVEGGEAITQKLPQDKNGLYTQTCLIGYRPITVRIETKTKGVGHEKPN